MNTPLVSVVVPAYNSSKYISNAIASVQAQTYLEWELLIIDDCSTDETVAYIEGFVEKDSRIRFFQLATNSGVSVARNIGIDNAEGKYIAFLDSDDEWLPAKLDVQVNYMEKNSVVFCYSSYGVMNEQSENISAYHIPQNRVSYQELLKGCIIGNLTAIYNVDFYGKRQFKNQGHEDYILWLELLKEIDHAHGINETLAKYRVSKNSISGNKLKAAKWQWNIYRKTEKMNVLKSCYYFCNYALNGIRKYR